MTKAGSLRKRYVAFIFKGPELSEESLKKNLYNEALKFFGEFGLSKVALKLVSYNPASCNGIIRCERSHLDEVLGFLALLDGSDTRFIALKSSGTLKSLESVLASSHSK